MMASVFGTCSLLGLLLSWLKCFTVEEASAMLIEKADFVAAKRITREAVKKRFKDDGDGTGSEDRAR